MLQHRFNPHHKRIFCSGKNANSLQNRIETGNKSEEEASKLVEGSVLLSINGLSAIDVPNHIILKVISELPAAMAVDVLYFKFPRSVNQIQYQLFSTQKVKPISAANWEAGQAVLCNGTLIVKSKESDISFPISLLNFKLISPGNETDKQKQQDHRQADCLNFVIEIYETIPAQSSSSAGSAKGSSSSVESANSSNTDTKKLQITAKRPHLLYTFLLDLLQAMKLSGALPCNLGNIYEYSEQLKRENR
jgi:hypothetical protein